MSHKNLPFIPNTLVLAISAILANSVTSNAYATSDIKLDGTTGSAKRLLTNQGSISGNATAGTTLTNTGTIKGTATANKTY